MDLITKLIPVIITSITAVEKLVRGKGKDKQDAAIDILKMSVKTIEEFKGKDIMKDSEIERAARSAIDAIIALSNAIEKKN